MQEILILEIIFLFTWKRIQLIPLTALKLTTLSLTMVKAKYRHGNLATRSHYRDQKFFVTQALLTFIIVITTLMKMVFDPPSCGEKVVLVSSFIWSSWLYSTKSAPLNKIMFTKDKLFMSMVGQSGSGKTLLIFSLLASPTTFYPPVEKSYYFYKQNQSLFKELSEKLEIEFVPRFHQGRWSRTIDLNTSQIVLFRSPDVQQIDMFGRQLNRTDFCRVCYKEAISEPFGYLLIDSDPIRSESLRFRSNIVGTAPSLFYLPSSLGEETPLINERWKIAYLAALAKRQEAQRLSKTFGSMWRWFTQLLMRMRIRHNQWKHSLCCKQFIALRRVTKSSV